MIIEIFEARGFTEPSTSLDTLVINLSRKYEGQVAIQKIDVLQKDAMKKHKDVVKLIKDKGLNVLPLIKLDKQLVEQAKLEKLMK